MPSKRERVLTVWEGHGNDGAVYVHFDNESCYGVTTSAEMRFNHTREPPGAGVLLVGFWPEFLKKIAEEGRKGRPKKGSPARGRQVVAVK